ncbi:prohead protease/major capsid protein fusion protein [Amorphus orientalis]|uniref:Phage head maturation protease/phage major head subunit gpT-like protein n=1 Tax=Amorphus orientalis TaxID=649198 RepID=A0AAE4ASZ2_9HYPH|nr:prohead protease/major capsid protein fusion protein [Amorphus orientalis]MDQ0315510.1 phage head maturation protease/phage major head subunit gpT-like protein [Amorphus orientalis]
MPEPNGPFTRAGPLNASSWSEDDWTFDLVLSTGAARTMSDSRGQFVEVLDLSGATWPDQIPLLDSHNRSSIDDQIGLVTDIRLEAGQLVGTARLSRHSERAKRVAAEIAGGQRWGVSVGYAVQKWAETKPAGQRTLTATKLTILEASLVSVPADPAATTRNQMPTTDTHTTETITTEAPAATRAEVNAHIRSTAAKCGLDQAWVDAQIDAEPDVATVNAAALEAMTARSTATAGIRTTTATVGTDHTDPESIRGAMANALAHRLAPGAVKLEGRATEYRGHRVLDMVGDLAVANGERVNLRDSEALLQRAVGAHSTSDFPLLLADAANKALLAQYSIAAPTYRMWAARKPFTDFREHSFLRVGDVPAFKEIHEGGETKYGTISENAEKVSAKEYGTGLAIGRRALINDDLSALADFSSGIAIRAANDENRLAYGVLSTNAALSDSTALFHANHGNLAASGGAIDAATVGAAVAALRAQTSLDGMPLNLQPAYLVVGPANEVKARQILAAVTATKATDVNVWSGFAELVVDANITGTDWYVFAAPAAAPVVVYGYVGGSEGPQVRSERDFDTQAVKVAASLDFACGAIDFRGAYRNAGS